MDTKEEQEYGRCQKKTIKNYEHVKNNSDVEEVVDDDICILDESKVDSEVLDNDMSFADDLKDFICDEVVQDQFNHNCENSSGVVRVKGIPTNAIDDIDDTKNNYESSSESDLDVDFEFISEHSFHSESINNEDDNNENSRISCNEWETSNEFHEQYQGVSTNFNFLKNYPEKYYFTCTQTASKCLPIYKNSNNVKNTLKSDNMNSQKVENDKSIKRIFSNCGSSKSLNEIMPSKCNKIVNNLDGGEPCFSLEDKVKSFEPVHERIVEASNISKEQNCPKNRTASGKDQEPSKVSCYINSNQMSTNHINKNLDFSVGEKNNDSSMTDSIVDINVEPDIKYTDSLSKYVKTKDNRSILGGNKCQFIGLKIPKIQNRSKNSVSDANKSESYITSPKLCSPKTFLNSLKKVIPEKRLQKPKNILNAKNTQKTCVKAMKCWKKFAYKSFGTLRKYPKRNTHALNMYLNNLNICKKRIKSVVTPKPKCFVEDAKNGVKSQAGLSTLTPTYNWPKKVKDAPHSDEKESSYLRRNGISEINSKKEEHTAKTILDKSLHSDKDSCIHKLDKRKFPFRVTKPLSPERNAPLVEKLNENASTAEEVGTVNNNTVMEIPILNINSNSSNLSTEKRTENVINPILKSCYDKSVPHNLDQVENGSINESSLVVTAGSDDKFIQDQKEEHTTSSNTAADLENLSKLKSLRVSKANAEGFCEDSNTSILENNEKSTEIINVVNDKDSKVSKVGTSLEQNKIFINESSSHENQGMTKDSECEAYEGETKLSIETLNINEKKESTDNYNISKTNIQSPMEAMDHVDEVVEKCLNKEKTSQSKPSSIKNRYEIDHSTSSLLSSDKGKPERKTDFKPPEKIPESEEKKLYSENDGQDLNKDQDFKQVEKVVEKHLNEEENMQSKLSSNEDKHEIEYDTCTFISSNEVKPETECVSSNSSDEKKDKCLPSQDKNWSRDEKDFHNDALYKEDTEEYKSLPKQDQNDKGSDKTVEQDVLSAQVIQEIKIPANTEEQNILTGQADTKNIEDFSYDSREVEHVSKTQKENVSENNGKITSKVSIEENKSDLRESTVEISSSFALISDRNRSELQFLYGEKESVAAVEESKVESKTELIGTDRDVGTTVADKNTDFKAVSRQKEKIEATVKKPKKEPTATFKASNNGDTAASKKKELEFKCPAKENKNSSLVSTEKTKELETPSKENFDSIKGTSEDGKETGAIAKTKKANSEETSSKSQTFSENDDKDEAGSQKKKDIILNVDIVQIENSSNLALNNEEISDKKYVSEGEEKPTDTNKNSTVDSTITETEVDLNYSQTEKLVRRRSPSKFVLRMKQEVQELCCGHWFPTTKSLVRHLIENSKSDSDSLHAARLIDIGMQKCSVCSIWLNFNAMKKHMKREHDLPKPQNSLALINSEKLSKEIFPPSVGSQPRTTVSDTFQESKDDNRLNKQTKITSKFELPVIKDVFSLSPAKPCPRSKKLFEAKDYAPITCDLSQDPNSLQNLVTVFSVEDLPTYFRPVIILKKCKSKLTKRRLRKKSASSTETNTLLAIKCKLKEYKDLNKIVNNTNSTEDPCEKTKNNCNDIEVRNLNNKTEAVKSGPKNGEVTKKFNYRKKVEVTTKFSACKKVELAGNAAKKAEESEKLAKKVGDTANSFKKFDKNSKSTCKKVEEIKPLEKKINEEKSIENVNEKLINRDSKLLGNREDLPSARKIKNNSKFKKVKMGMLKVKGEVLESLPTATVTNNLKCLDQPNANPSSPKIDATVDEHLVENDSNHKDKKECTTVLLSCGEKKPGRGRPRKLQRLPEESEIFKATRLGRIKIRRGSKFKGRKVRKRTSKYGFGSSDSSESSEMSDSSVGEFEMRTEKEDYKENEESIPTVELDLFTLSAVEEDVSVLLVDPLNPDFKVFASMDAIFVGDSALGDVTNHMGYISDNNNVVYVNPGHFLFPKIDNSDKENPPVLKSKKTVKTLTKLKDQDENSKPNKILKTSNVTESDMPNQVSPLCSNDKENKSAHSKDEVTSTDKTVLKERKENVLGSTGSNIKASLPSDVSIEAILPSTSASIKAIVPLEDTVIKANLHSNDTIIKASLPSNDTTISANLPNDSSIKDIIPSNDSSIKAILPSSDANMKTILPSPDVIIKTNIPSTDASIKVAKEASLPETLTSDEQKEPSIDFSEAKDEESEKISNMENTSNIPRCDKMPQNKAKDEHLKATIVISKTNSTKVVCSPIDKKVIVIKTSMKKAVNNETCIIKAPMKKTYIDESYQKPNKVSNDRPHSEDNFSKVISQEEIKVLSPLKDKKIVKTLSIKPVKDVKIMANTPYKVIANSCNPIIPNNIDCLNLETIDYIDLSSNVPESPVVQNDSKVEGLKADFLLNFPSTISDISPVKSKTLSLSKPKALLPVQILKENESLVATAEIGSFETLEGGICLEDIIKEKQNFLLSGDLVYKTSAKASPKCEKFETPSPIPENKLVEKVSVVDVVGDNFSDSDLDESSDSDSKVSNHENYSLDDSIIDVVKGHNLWSTPLLFSPEKRFPKEPDMALWDSLSNSLFSPSQNSANHNKEKSQSVITDLLKATSPKKNISSLKKCMSPLYKETPRTIISSKKEALNTIFSYSSTSQLSPIKTFGSPTTKECSSLNSLSKKNTMKSKNKQKKNVSRVSKITSKEKHREFKKQQSEVKDDFKISKKMTDTHKIALQCAPIDDESLTDADLNKEIPKKESLKMRIVLKDFPKTDFSHISRGEASHRPKHKKKKKHSKNKRKEREYLEAVSPNKRVRNNLDPASFQIKNEVDKEAALIVKDNEDKKHLNVAFKKEKEYESSETTTKDSKEASDMLKENETVKKPTEKLVLKQFYSFGVTQHDSSEAEASYHIKTEDNVLNVTNNEYLDTTDKTVAEQIDIRNIDKNPEISNSNDMKNSDFPAMNIKLDSELVDDRHWHSRNAKLKAQVMITDHQKGISNTSVVSGSSDSEVAGSKCKKKVFYSKDIRSFFSPSGSSSDESLLKSPPLYFSKSTPFLSPSYSVIPRVKKTSGKSNSKASPESIAKNVKTKRKRVENIDIRKFFTVKSSFNTSNEEHPIIKKCRVPNKPEVVHKTEIVQVKQEPEDLHIKEEPNPFDFEGFKDCSNHSEERLKLLQEYVDVLEMNTWFNCNRFPVPLDQLCDWDDDQLNNILFEKG